MGNIRVTERSIAISVLNNLQSNISRVSQSQEQLSSGKLIARASDDPAGTVTALQLRSGVASQKQYSRNADDGISWLGLADSTLTTMNDTVTRARDLVLQGMSSGSYGSEEARGAIASEVDQIRESVISMANTKYLDRPIFGGTTVGTTAFDTSGTYAGDGGAVYRTVADNAKVRVDVDGQVAFGSGPNQLFTVLSDISAQLRSGDTVGLGESLTNLDTSSSALRNAQSSVGARYNQLVNMRQAADDGVLNLSTQLSNVEDIDLPKTITELTLQQTAYQAALAAAARVVQPSLVDFLR